MRMLHRQEAPTRGEHRGTRQSYKAHQFDQSDGQLRRWGGCQDRKSRRRPSGSDLPGASRRAHRWQQRRSAT